MIPWPTRYTSIPSAHFTKDRKRSGRLIDPSVIVVHTTEGHENQMSARNTAAWFRNPLAKVSAHFVVDAGEIIECVRPTDTAWHAGTANPFSIGIEICGTARQSAAQWLDDYSVATLKRAATLIAELGITFGIDVRKLDDAELLANYNGTIVSGVCGHDDVSRVLGGTHWDPGPQFPWQDFMLAIHGYRELLTQEGFGQDA